MKKNNIKIKKKNVKSQTLKSEFSGKVEILREKQHSERKVTFLRQAENIQRKKI